MKQTSPHSNCCGEFSLLATITNRIYVSHYTACASIQIIASGLLKSSFLPSPIGIYMEAVISLLIKRVGRNVTVTQALPDSSQTSI